MHLEQYVKCQKYWSRISGPTLQTGFVGASMLKQPHSYIRAIKLIRDQWARFHLFQTYNPWAKFNYSCVAEILRERDFSSLQRRFASAAGSPDVGRPHILSARKYNEKKRKFWAWHVSSKEILLYEERPRMLDEQESFKDGRVIMCFHHKGQLGPEEMPLKWLDLMLEGFYHRQKQLEDGHSNKSCMHPPQ